MLETKSISLFGDIQNNTFILNPLNYALMEVNLKFIPNTSVYLKDWQFVIFINIKIDIQSCKGTKR